MLDVATLSYTELSVLSTVIDLFEFEFCDQDKQQILDNFIELIIAEGNRRKKLTEAS